MNFYFAPMEGLTNYIYRNAHHAYFGGVDKYFSPFISTTQKGSLRTRERNDILPENNQGIVLVPQLLSNNALDFIETSKEIKQLGYQTINLNLGCPSQTVVSKNKGSGFLLKTEELHKFLEEIYSASVTKISVKTRIGKNNPDEFYNLLEIFNEFPLEELIIHPRTQQDFYKNQPNLGIFRDALRLSKNPVCYNGDIFTVDEYMNFIDKFDQVETLMIGRGLLTNPGLVHLITAKQMIDKHVLLEFHNRIYEAHKENLFGNRNVLFKMKELWFYMIQLFSNNEVYWKKIRKVERVADYEKIVKRIFDEQEILI
ncbi:MAG: tRNA dihydrouridine synthase [Velocimicrobium sp.]